LNQKDEIMKILADLGKTILFLILMVSCSTSEIKITSQGAADIEGTQWQIVEVSGSPVPRLSGGKQPHIILDPEQKKVMGFSGCNNFFGSYELDGDSLEFGPAGSTRMACPEPEAGVETEVFKILDKTRGWRINDNTLILLGDSGILARLSKEDTERGAKIVGTVWRWVQTQYNDDRKIVPAETGNYTVRFKEDGTLSVRADCNQKGGTYSVAEAENRISIEITHSTMAACPEGSLEDEFVRGLSAASIYFIKNGDLYIDLKYDSGTMRFSKQ